MKIKKIVLDIDGSEVTISGDDIDAITKVLNVIQGKEKEYIPYPIYPEPVYPYPIYPEPYPHITCDSISDNKFVM